MRPLHPTLTVSIVLVLLASAQPGWAQFTPLTGIPPVQDGGDSRSVNWVDIDGDGDQDLFITNSSSSGAVNFLYRNDGGGAWTKIVSGEIVEDSVGSVGASWGDFDNDGDPDCYVTNWYSRKNDMYVNNGDWTFTKRGNTHPTNAVDSSEDCAWVDYDNDGLLDLFVTNSGGSGEPNDLYHNEGEGVFTKIQSGSIVTDSYKSRGCAWGDYDRDGDQDVFVCNEGGQDNQLYENLGDGTFAAITTGPHVSDGGYSMSANWVDWDNDRDLDLFVANEHNTFNFMYRNDGPAGFTEITSGALVDGFDYSFGSIWADWDNDGDQDLHVSKAYYPGRTADLFRNDGGEFTELTDEVTTNTNWTYGAAFGDPDNDGQLDLASAHLFNLADNSLYANDGTANHWLRVNLTGVASNRSGVGARVEILATIGGQPVWQILEVSTKHGYAAQNNIHPHFGLGDAASADSVTITWPSGTIQQVTNVPSNQVLELTEPSQSSVNDLTRHQGVRILGNVPNPFNPETSVKFEVDEATHVTVAVHDAGGRLVNLLHQGLLPAGTHTRTWNGRDMAGRRQAAGVYFASLVTNQCRCVNKMVLLP